jgi:hypothetical protein
VIAGGNMLQVLILSGDFIYRPQLSVGLGSIATKFVCRQKMLRIVIHRGWYPSYDGVTARTRLLQLTRFCFVCVANRPRLSVAPDSRATVTLCYYASNKCSEGSSASREARATMS